MVNSGVDSSKNVYPILVDSSGRPYVILYDPASVAFDDTIAAKPDGIAVFGRNQTDSKWDELPIAMYTDPVGNKGRYVVPVTPMTSERLEGTKLTDGTNTVDTVKDNLTGRTSLLTTRGHGKNTKTIEYTANTAATALITPTANFKLDVCGVYTSSDSAAGDIALDFATSSIKVWRHYLTKYNTASASEMHIEGATDEVLTVTTTQGNQDVFIIVNYREVA